MMKDVLELNTILKQIENCCSFSLSKEMIQQEEVRYSPLVIRQNLSRAKEALEMCVKDGMIPMAGMKDLSEALESASKGACLSAHELLDIAGFITGVQNVIGYAKNSVVLERPALDDLFSSLIDEKKLAEEILLAIDDYGEILDSASPALRTIRHDIIRTEHEISAAANRFIARNKDAVVDSIVTVRAGRTVVLIRSAEKNQFGGLLHGESASGQASYIEPEVLVSLNNRKEELQEKEKEEIERILRLLSAKVSTHAAALSANLLTCTLLDAIFAKALWGMRLDGCVAEITEERNLEIRKARHPLIDPKTVVANSYTLKDPQRMLLITGPNTGGKTVSMKIIGLFTLLTYLGIPLPSESALIPLFDCVYADIGDSQSVTESLSSFSGHIKALAEIVRNASENSLVLVDEIGSGTDPIEGESLAIAVLNELRSRKCMSVTTTHYSRLKAYGKRHEDIALGTVEFDMKRLAPTYRYLEGMTGQSNALEVAQRYGLPKRIINYARLLKKQARSEEDVLIERLEKQLGENVQKERLLQEKLDAQKILETTLKQKLNHLEKEKDRWYAEREEEARRYLEQIQKEADGIMKDLRSQQENIRYHEAIEKRKELTRILHMPEETVKESNDAFVPGDIVELRANDAVCRVVKTEKKDIIIELNGRQVHVKKNQIRHSLKTLPKKEEKTGSSSFAVRFTDSVPYECNLIGKRVDEAREELLHYLDQIKLYHMPSARIIHGDGTGALRKLVHQTLDKDPSVKGYRLGMPNEGGTGATIVELK